MSTLPPLSSRPRPPLPPQRRSGPHSSRSLVPPQFRFDLHSRSRFPPFRPGSNLLNRPAATFFPLGRRGFRSDLSPADSLQPRVYLSLLQLFSISLCCRLAWVPFPPRFLGPPSLEPPSPLITVATQSLSPHFRCLFVCSVGVCFSVFFETHALRPSHFSALFLLVLVLVF